MKNLFILAAMMSICHAGLTFKLTSNVPPDTVDLIVNNVTIVDVVTRRVIPTGTIYINDGNIVSLTARENTIARNTIDGSALVAMPGFINTHTHLWQHISKSCVPNDKLTVWVAIYQVVHYLSEQDVYDVVLAACSEAMLSGITSVSDYASLAFNDYSLNSSCKAMRDAGMGGAVIWHNPSIFIPDSIKISEINKLKAAYSKDFDLWMGHGPLSFSPLPQVYSGIAIAKQLGMKFSEHTMENIQEQRDFHKSVTAYLQTYGTRLSKEDRTTLEKITAMQLPSRNDTQYFLEQKARDVVNDPTLSQNLSDEERRELQELAGGRTISPLPLLLDWGILNNYLAIHAVWPQMEDIAIMKEKNISISHNPESNMYLSSGIAPIYRYKKENILTTIGTDGAASNDGINFFSAMRNMWNLNKLNLMNTTIKDVNEWEVLQAATINGAKALQIADKTGSIEVGKEADIILLKKQSLGMAPFRDTTLPALIIYSASPSSIQHVISNGKVVVENGRLVGRDEAQLAGQLSAIAAKVDELKEVGKAWTENITLDRNTVGKYWYQYRSVRKPDKFDLKFENKDTRHEMILHIVSSGDRFGGGTPTVIDREIAQRFPHDVLAGSFNKKIVLKPKDVIMVKKQKGVYNFSVTVNGKSEELTGAVGQLLVIAFPGKK